MSKLETYKKALRLATDELYRQRTDVDNEPLYCSNCMAGEDCSVKCKGKNKYKNCEEVWCSHFVRKATQKELKE
jgi:hypothetical protein